MATDKLLIEAKAAMAKAYAPYSNFQVGAALAVDGGEVFTGCNVENAAYPEGTCAEAGAIAAMALAGHRKITELVVVGQGDGLCTPCGGCRQKIREFSSAETKVHVAGPEGVRKTYSMADLLPDSFGPENLD